MKYDKTIEKWFKQRNDDELLMLHALIKDERAKDISLFAAFRWTVNESSELSKLKNPTPLYDPDKDNSSLTAQFDYIDRCKKTGACIRCHKPYTGIIKESINKDTLDVPLADYLFLSVHKFSGLCTDCIGKFLVDFVEKYNSDREG